MVGIRYEEFEYKGRTGRKTYILTTECQKETHRSFVREGGLVKGEVTRGLIFRGDTWSMSSIFGLQ